MKVNRDNYEIYFIDYLDGTLANEHVDDLLDFLRDNPDLSEELRGLHDIILLPNKGEHFDWSKLKRNDLDHPDQFNESCVRYIENDMDDIELENFNAYVSTHPDKRKSLHLFSATILEPDLMTIFENKESLKHRGRIISPYWYWAAAILVIGVILISIPEKNVPSIQMAKVEPIQMELPKVEIKTTTTPYMQIKSRSFEEENNTKIKNDPNIESEETATTNEELAYLQPKAIETLQLPIISNQLAVMPKNHLSKDYSKYQTIPELMAEKVQNLEPKEKLNQMGRETLSAIENISNNKFEFAKNTQGKLKKIEFNSKFLAFTIPVNSNK